MTEYLSMLGNTNPTDSNVLISQVVFEIGNSFSTSSTGYIYGFRYFRSTNETGLHTGRLWNTLTSTLITSQLFINESASGWQTQLLTTPVLISPSTSYTVSVNHQARFARTLAPWSLSPPSPLSLIGSRVNFLGTTPGVFPASTTPNLIFVDILFSASMPSNGIVTIVGTALENKVLTAVINDPNGVASSISYQWQSSLDSVTWGNISGATEISLLLTRSLVGRIIRTLANYEDSGGTTENLTSAPTAIVTPVNSPGQLILTGIPAQGQTLSTLIVDADQVASDVVYTWESSNNDNTWNVISGANTNSMTLTQQHVGLYIRAKVFYTDLYGTAESLTSLGTIPVLNINDQGVVELTLNVEGEPIQGATLTAVVSDVDGIENAEISYQWVIIGCDITCQYIQEENSATLLLTNDFVGKSLRVLAFYQDDLGTNEVVISSPTAIVQNINDLGSINITGVAAQRQILTAIVQDLDGVSTINYQWQSSIDGTNWTNISGATDSTLTLTSLLVDKRVRAIANYTDDAGTSESLTSSATNLITSTNTAGSIVIAGSPVKNQVLTAFVNDSDGLGAISYQWQSSIDGTNWTNISGATDSTLTLISTLVGKRVRALANYTDDAGTSESLTSSATNLITSTNAVGSIIVAGSPVKNQVLTAFVNDSDGLGAISYQWQSSIDGTNWTNISGATDSTLTLISTLVGKRVRALANYTDDAGTSESLTSNPTPFIADSPKINILGELLYGETLTVDIQGMDEISNISYQWLSNDGLGWVHIENATTNTLLLNKALVGKSIRVVIDYSIEEGGIESLISLPTSIILNVNSPGIINLQGVFVAGETLTTTVEDEDGLTNATITYLWQQTIDEIQWTDIGRETSSSLELTSDFIGKKIRAIASYQDDLGTDEVVTSQASEIILATPDPGIVFITGIVRQHNTLTAVIEDVNGIEEDSPIYVWEYSRDRYEWIIAPDETESTIYLSQPFFNKFIQVQVTYRTSLGNEVEIYSDPTPQIAEPLSKLSYLGASNPYDLVPVTNAVFTFKPAQDWAIDPDTGNSIPVLSGDLILCSATLKQKKDPNLVIQSGVDYNRMYFEGYLSEPNTLVDTQQSKNVTAVINNRIGIFDFVPILESVEEVSLKQRDKNGQLVAGYFRFS